jgi:hypothetical protein
MDYKKHYINLIKTRLNRKLESGVYYEKHHIVPKCIGGSDRKENIIKLTAREHYIAHWLLYRMRPHSNGISFAFWKMTFPGSKFLEKRDYTISSRAYAEAKMAMAEANRRLNTGRKISKFHLKKWSNNKNNTKAVVNIKTGEEFSNAKMVWNLYFKDSVSYSGFNCWLRNKLKGSKSSNKKSKLLMMGIEDWKYRGN